MNPVITTARRPRGKGLRSKAAKLRKQELDDLRRARIRSRRP